MFWEDEKFATAEILAGLGDILFLLLRILAPGRIARKRNILPVQIVSLIQCAGWRTDSKGVKCWATVKKKDNNVVQVDESGVLFEPRQKKHLAFFGNWWIHFHCIFTAIVNAKSPPSSFFFTKTTEDSRGLLNGTRGTCECDRRQHFFFLWADFLDFSPRL